MANLTNITDEALSVPLLGRVVDPGETVDVADYLLDEYVWPDVTWKVEKAQTAKNTEE